MQCKYHECNGTGFIPVTLENGEQEYKLCRCKLAKAEQDTLRRKLIEASIPTNYWDYTIENYLSLPFPPQIREFNKPKIEVIQNFIKDPHLFIQGKQVLWIWGEDNNSCHTTLAVMLGTELLKHNYKVLFTSFSKLLNRFVDFDNKDKVEKELKGKDVYIIDDAFDMSRCAPGSYRQGQLFTFLDDILSNSKHIICTSNCPVSSIDDTFMQSKIILSRSLISLEIKGSVSTLVRHLSTNK